MTLEPQKCELHLREASGTDISVMAEHHRKMFEEIWEKKGEHLDILRAEEIKKTYAQKLKTEMESGICRAWVIEENGRIVSRQPAQLIFFLHKARGRKTHHSPPWDLP
ncbi:MAG: hypothetical protein ACQETR_07755 [Thermodesulfobacteriota bacterium]